jgi:hypothetical protein
VRERALQRGEQRVPRPHPLLQEKVGVEIGRTPILHEGGSLED